MDKLLRTPANEPIPQALSQEDKTTWVPTLATKEGYLAVYIKGSEGTHDYSSTLEEIKKTIDSLSLSLKNDLSDISISSKVIRKDVGDIKTNTDEMKDALNKMDGSLTQLNQNIIGMSFLLEDKLNEIISKMNSGGSGNVDQKKKSLWTRLTDQSVSGTNSGALSLFDDVSKDDFITFATFPRAQKVLLSYTPDVIPRLHVDYNVVKDEAVVVPYTGSDAQDPQSISMFFVEVDMSGRGPVLTGSDANSLLTQMLKSGEADIVKTNDDFAVIYTGVKVFSNAIETYAMSCRNPNGYYFSPSSDQLKNMNDTVENTQKLGVAVCCGFLDDGDTKITPVPVWRQFGTNYKSTGNEYAMVDVRDFKGNTTYPLTDTTYPQGYLSDSFLQKSTSLTIIDLKYMALL